MSPFFSVLILLLFIRMAVIIMPYNNLNEDKKIPPQKKREYIFILKVDYSIIS